MLNPIHVSELSIFVAINKIKDYPRPFFNLIRLGFRIELTESPMWQSSALPIKSQKNDF